MLKIDLFTVVYRSFKVTATDDLEQAQVEPTRQILALGHDLLLNLR